MEARGKIESGLLALSVSYDDQLVNQCLHYLQMLVRWNKVTNLTAVRDLEEMVSVHLLDSLAILPFVTGNSILDVGSGAGLPGIPLAMCCPDKDFILLDSNGKKTRFMTQAVIELALSNVTVVHDRVESCRQHFDHVVCRAFTSLEEFVALCGKLLVPDGSLLAMKGPSESETTDIVGWRTTSHQLSVPHLNGDRYLIELRK